MRCPFRGCCFAYLLRIAIRPGISCSASMISLRPQSARERSRTLKSIVAFFAFVAICSFQCS